MSHIAVIRWARVVSTAGLFGGEPHFDGLRIRVRDVVLARGQGGYTPEEIAATIYPDLSLAQVYSALAYYEDRAGIEQAVYREWYARSKEEHEKAQIQFLENLSRREAGRGV